MNAKQYLQQIQKADTHINNLIAEKEQYQTIAECAGGIPITEKVMSSPRPDKMENAVVKMIEVEIELFECIDEFVDLKRHTIKEIENIGDENYYNVLYKRYVEGKDFDEISEEMCYSVKYVRNMHVLALSEFNRLYLS